MKKRAVIYCRVSSVDQVENTSLSMQVKQCTEYCFAQGWEIAGNFIEEGESAKTTDRKELLKLLIYCRENKNNIGFIIVWKVDRFARNLYDYLNMKKEMLTLGISIRSVSEPFKDDPEGKLMESIFATFAQYDNDLRAKRTKEGMYARLNDGYWVTKSPLGYINARTDDGKPIIKECPENSLYVKKAFEMASQGIYSQTEIVDYLNSMGMQAKQATKLCKQSLQKILTNRVYVGDVRLKSGQFIPGKHEPIIEQEVFDRVQGIISGSVQALVPHARKNAEFPLRAFVVCGKCGTPLTGSFSTSHTGKKYPYYRCQKSGCSEVNIRKEVIEQKFLGLLDSLKPEPEYMQLLEEVIKDMYENKEMDNITIKSNLENELKKCSEQKDRLTEALADGNIRSDDYRSAINKIESKRLAKTLELQDLKIEIVEIDSVMEYARHVVLNASRLWQESTIDQRGRLQSVFFPKGLRFDKEGFKVPEMGYFFKICSELAGKSGFYKKEMGWLISINWNFFINSMLIIWSLKNVVTYKNTNIEVE